MASAKQCGRAVVPVIHEPLGFEHCLETTVTKEAPGLMLVEPGAAPGAVSLRELGAARTGAYFATTCMAVAALLGVAALVWHLNDPSEGAIRAARWAERTDWVRLGAAPAGDFYTLTPCRLLDTRLLPSGPSPIASGTTRLLDVFAVSTCGVPAGATALAINFTSVGSTSAEIFLRSRIKITQVPTGLSDGPRFVRISALDLAL